MRYSDRLRNEQNLWTGILEPFPNSHLRPAVHDPGVSSRNFLRRPGVFSQSARALHCAQFGARSHGFDDHMAQVHQHPTRVVCDHDRWHCNVSLELCESGYNVYHVSSCVCCKLSLLMFISVSSPAGPSSCRPWWVSSSQTISSSTNASCISRTSTWAIQPRLTGTRLASTGEHPSRGPAHLSTSSP